MNTMAGKYKSLNKDDNSCKYGNKYVLKTEKWPDERSNTVIK